MLPLEIKQSGGKLLPHSGFVYCWCVSFYEELEQVFDHFPKYHMKILLGGFNAKVGERIFSNQQLGMRVYIRIITIMR
jgi:hypothetical protein